jgi:chromosome segregation ATPase
MIKIFSIKEIIQASTDILNSQKLEKTNIKNTTDDKEKIIPNPDYKNLIDEKMLSSKPLVLKKEIKKSEDIPPSVEKIISQAEEKQFKILSKTSKTIKNLDYQKIVDELYKLLNKKIKKNTLKLIVDLRNNIVSLDKKLIFLKEKEQKITINNKLLKHDIKNLINTQNSLQYDVKKKDLDLDFIKIKLIGRNDKIIKLKDNNEQIIFDLQSSQNKNSKLDNINNELRDNINELKTKITNDQNKLNQLEEDKYDLNLKLNGYKNQNIELENNNKNLEQDNNELKIKITNDQNKLNQLEEDKYDLNLKLNGYKNQNIELENNNKNLEQDNNELKTKTDKFQDELEYFKKINSELKIKL